jgi:nucleoside-diphosphate-sugar epimerase
MTTSFKILCRSCASYAICKSTKKNNATTCKSYWVHRPNIDSDEKIEIEFIDMPDDIKDKYQYFTQANINKLRSIGYTKPFYTFEEAIDDYIKNYLDKL